jgi:hypothetical protein
LLLYKLNMVDQEQIKKMADKMADLVDTNKDGKISVDEVKTFISNTKNIKFMLYILLSILVGPAIEWFSNSVATGNWQPDGLFSFAQVIIPSVILGYYFKGLLDLADKEKKDLEEKNKKLQEDMNQMKLEFTGEKQQLNLTIKQLEGNIECKNTEIEWREKGLVMRKE